MQIHLLEVIMYTITYFFVKLAQFCCLPVSTLNSTDGLFILTSFLRHFLGVKYVIRARLRVWESMCMQLSLYWRPIMWLGLCGHYFGKFSNCERKHLENLAAPYHCFVYLPSTL